MIMNRLIFIFILTFGISFYCYGQKDPIKFGNVSLEELQMTSSYLDSTAPAVVLCDYGYFRASSWTFTRNVRIKILKKEGYNWANMSFRSEFKSTLKGITTNLENGKIVQEKLNNESIFITRIINDYFVLRAAMPNVKVGSVIDFEFSFHGMPSEWRFQEEIPVVFSELMVEESPQITFRPNFFGYERLTYTSPNKWIARDMPAFKEEPFMSSTENYITKLKFDLVKVYFTNINSTWLKVNEILLESKVFGMPGTATSYLNDLAKQLSNSHKNREDLLKTAYDTIRERIVWNDLVQLSSTDGNLSRVFKLKVGNSADVNLILYNLLKKLDFEVAPVALSTRDNGTISLTYPSLRQLNYVIVHVKIGEKEYLLDATEKYLPFNLLPLRCLNVQGRLIDKYDDIWIPISNNKKIKDLAVFDLVLENDLSMKGNVSCMWYDYSAYNFRKNYSKFNSQDEYMESYLKDMPGMTIGDMKIENLDSIYKPVTEKLTVEIKNQVTQTDNNLYITPLYFEDLKENPFKSEVRKYPIDFGIPIDKTVMLNLTLPDGYSPVSLPQAVSFKLPDNSGVFMYEVVIMDNKIRLTTKFDINKIVFTTDEYNDLKEFYNQVIKKKSEPIILKKN
jgi:hypothetical protein